VGTFLGASNVLVGRARGGEACFGPLRLPIPAEQPHEDGALVRLLFRPEDASVGWSEPSAGSHVLGRGPVVERSVTGPWMRVRLRLASLPETRQLSPVASLGAEGLLIDALLPAEAAVPDEPAWLSLRAWHVLEPQRARLLVLAAAAAPAAGLGLARELARRMDAHLTVLAVGRDSRAAAALGFEVERQLQDGSVGHAQVLVRVGDAVKEILGRQAEVPHDLVVVSERREPARRRIGSGVAPLLERAQVPILIVKGTRPAFKHVLICTAAGEAGKSDVHVGGRLAQLLNAAVTVLFVVRGGGPPGSVERTHLERAAGNLGALGVATELRFRAAPSPAEGILSEARDRDPDLIVVGNHHTGRAMFGAENVTLQVLAGADRPVLVVPADASL
jgi:nucleotide-binding universal stress UspA family protein